MINVLIICTVLVACTSQQKSDKNTGWAETIEILKTTDIEHDCAKIWGLLWPWALSGKSEASLTLAQFVQWRHLTPKNSGEDSLARLRLAMGLYKMAAYAGNKTAMNELAGFYSADLFGSPADQELAGCWQSTPTDSANLEKCKSLESKASIIPEPEKLISDLKGITEAKCLVKQGDKILLESLPITSVVE